MPELDSFTRQYTATALWSSNDDSGGEPLDRNYDISDIAPDALAKMVADCAAFQEQCDAWINDADDTGECRRGPDCNTAWERAGHDFWLTRNHHGASFWDGDWPEPYATQLTDAAHAFGECDLYVSDDGSLYLYP
jgi:hypothetical protein